MSRPNRLLAIIIVAAVVAAIYPAALRWRAEMPNRTVALVADWQEVEALAAMSGQGVPQALERLRNAGITAVAVREQHLSYLVEAGAVSVLPASATEVSGAPPASEAARGGIVLSAYDAVTADRLRAHLSAKLAPGAVPPPTPGLSPLLVPVRVPVAYLETVGLGWPDDEPLAIGEAGLDVVARMDNYAGASPRGIIFMVAQAAAAGARLVIFTGDQVLGYPGLVRETAETLQLAEINYGSVELAEQLGDARLGQALDGELVRVHSIVEGEMATMSPDAAVGRYVRSVRERGIRACYVRLFLAPRKGLAEFNVRYARALKRELRAAGYDTGSPRPLTPVSVPYWVVMLLGAGAVAAAVFALGRAVPLSEWLTYVLLIVGACAGVALFKVSPHWMRAEKALLAAIAFPSIALIAVAAGVRVMRAPPRLSCRGLAVRAGAWLIGASAVSVAGGLVVAGLLSERLYMAKVLDFTGVKLALALPMLVVWAVWSLGLYARGGWANYRRRVKENFRQVWNRPVYVWEAALAAVLVAAAALMLMRSGNQPAVEVSGLEVRVRGLLEQALFVRPRTKEFLVGHPALMLAVAMALRGRTRWVLVFLLLGAVGQTSVVNTFCHLHSPLLISLVRTANGLWLGLATGAIVVWAWDRLRAEPADAREAQS